MFLSHHMIFSLERAAVVWAILEGITGFEPSLEMIAPRYLKFSTSSSSTFYLDLSLEAIWVICHHLDPISCLGRSTFCILWWLYRDGLQDASFFFLFCIYDNVICKAEFGNKSSSDADTTFNIKINACKRNIKVNKLTDLKN